MKISKPLISFVLLIFAAFQALCQGNFPECLVKYKQDSLANPPSHKKQGSVMSPPNDMVEEEMDTLSPRFVPYTFLRQADVMWKKRIWRIIDLREKINLPLYYPVSPNENRISVFDAIKCALQSGDITAYDFGLDVDNSFTVPKTKTEVGQMLSHVDTLQDENGNPKAVRTDITPDKIRQYWLKEDWFFDKQRSVMDVRILGVAPAIATVNANTGEETGDVTQLCWIYFPELRPLFKVLAIYNVNNDAECRSLDDIFWKRHFSSYIFQESNVYNRSIQSYMHGIDTQLESEKIKKKMFDIEHDMWQY